MVAKKYKQKLCQWAPRHRIDQEKPKKVTLGPKEPRPSQTAVSKYNAANSLMELHIEMWSSDTDMDVDEPTDLVRVQLRAPEVQPAFVNYGKRNGQLVKHTLITCF
jgi:hypothetical protein